VQGEALAVPRGCVVSSPPKKAVPPVASLNFLLGASDASLDEFELARLAEVADLRSELHGILDKLIDEMSAAAVAGWFRQANRAKLKQAILETPEASFDRIMDWAKDAIRDGQRSASELVPRASLPAGAAHLAASLRYQERHVAKGLCCKCPLPLDRNSVRYCTKHLEQYRARYKPKNAKGAKPGTIGWLYSEEPFQSTHGKQPGTVKALKEANEKSKRRGKP
jgi:hypothetical protein